MPCFPQVGVRVIGTTNKTLNVNLFDFDSYSGITEPWYINSGNGIFGKEKQIVAKLNIPSYFGLSLLSIHLKVFSYIILYCLGILDLFIFC
jgi:hypothetical protein